MSAYAVGRKYILQLQIAQRKHLTFVIYSDAESPPLLDGFSTLFLNRVNYSGVLFAGPLGGNNQASAYPVDCRFNKDNIIERIQTIADLRDSMSVLRLYKI